TEMLNSALDRDEVVLMEGGQATFLDVDHGTYPFVTSSNPTAGGACTGTGVGPTRIDRVIGIVKAYTTRVGAGPFPTELFDKWGAYLQTTGGEVGVNTGRPRRCGWYDALMIRHATRINGFTDIVLTKLDVLTGIDEVPICTGYDVDGVIHREMPMTQTEFHHATPVYETLPGWTEDISQARTFDDLPENARPPSPSMTCCRRQEADVVTRRTDPQTGDAALQDWARATTASPAEAISPPRSVLAPAVRRTLELFAAEHPGGAVELRVPP